MKNKLPGVLKSNGSNAEKINKTDNSETDLIYPSELQEEEQYRLYFKEVLELEILEQGYPADKAVLYELLWRGKAERGGEKPPDEAGFLAYPVHIGVLKRKQHSDSEHSGAVGEHLPHDLLHCPDESASGTVLLRGSGKLDHEAGRRRRSPENADYRICGFRPALHNNSCYRKNLLFR